MSDTVISVEHLSKRYRLGVINTGTFKDDLKVWFAQTLGKPNPLSKVGEAEHGNREGDTIWALKDINFTVQRGEALGIIGRNGAGKSTLLKIISRVTTPTEGHVHVNGRIASLLEVGTGFHPELTGRENIYLNGAIMGMNRAEVNRKLDEIIDFSGVEKFIDTPVKRYSSGMYVRLAFAVAAHLESEILIVDEVLAVGDASFQKKSISKMNAMANDGRTVLFVSHNLSAIKKFCNRGIVLEKGEIKVDSGIENAISDYIISPDVKNNSTIILSSNNNNLFGNGIEVNIFDSDFRPKTEFSLHEAFSIDFQFRIKKRLTSIIAACGISNSDFGFITTIWSSPKDLEPGIYHAIFKFDLPLTPMDLQIGVGLSANGQNFYYQENIGYIRILDFMDGKQPINLGGNLLMSKEEAIIEPIS